MKIITEEPTILSEEIQKFRVEPETALSIKEHFAAFEVQAHEWEQKAKSLIVTSETQLEEIQQAREARLALKNIRVAVDKKHKELKEDSLRKGQLLDSIKRKLTGLIEPIEDHLLQQENYVKIQKELIEKKLFDERVQLLIPYLGEDARNIPLGGMSGDAFNNLLSGQKLAHEAKIKEQERIDQELIEAERKRVEEEKRLREENERLRKEREKQEAKLKKERDERLRLEREQREREEQEEADRKAILAAQRKAKRAPDKQKLFTFAENLRRVQCEKLKDEEAQKILTNAISLLDKVERYIKTNADTL